MSATFSTLFLVGSVVWAIGLGTENFGVAFMGNAMMLIGAFL